jgi:hypothetical protein
LIELGAKLNKSENEKRTRKSIQLKRLNAKIARTPKCGIFLKESVAKKTARFGVLDVAKICNQFK